MERELPERMGSEGKKPIASLEPTLFAEVLSGLGHVGRTHALRVKVSPLSGTLVDDIALELLKAPFVRSVVATNTLPNQEPKKADGTDALHFTVPNVEGVQNMGGMAGRGVKDASLFTVRELRKLLPQDVRIIGCGGIFNGQDVIDYYNVGASGVQIGTAFWEYGGKIFSDVVQEASALDG